MKIFKPNSIRISEDVYGKAHFGGNFLALTDRVGPRSTFDETADTLGLEHLRYPGGALTESSFSLKAPDASRVINQDTGEERSFVGSSEFFSYAGPAGHAITHVIPTRTYLSDRADENGDRYADIEEPVIRDYIRRLAEGSNEGLTEIAAFEIGNEYWGSGLMNALEYGRVSSRMAEIIREEISRYPESGAFEDTKILVQMGMNYGTSDLSGQFEGTAEEQIAAVNVTYGLNLVPDDFIYSSGEVAWAKVNNAIVIKEFETPSQLDAVDGVIAHIYSKGSDNPNSRYFEMSQINDTWREIRPDLDVHVTEWNLKRTVADDRSGAFGLKQAHEMLNIVEAFEWGGVASAHVWPVQMNARTALAGAEGSGGLRVAGAMFRIMNEKLVGTRVMSLDGSSGRETEISGQSADLHTFFSDARLVAFVAGKTDQPSQQTVDFTGLIESSGFVSVTRLNVQPGEDPTATGAEPMVSVSFPETIVGNGGLTVTLAPYEIVIVEANFPTFTPEVIAQAPVADQPAPVNLLLSLGDAAGQGLDHAIVTFHPDDTAPAQTMEEIAVPGGYGLALGQDVKGRLEVGRLFDAETDPEIGVSDALEALRLAVGLEPRFGPATPFDLIAADIDQNGQVSVGDALDILRASAGKVPENAPRWIFLDDDQDFSGMTANNVSYQTGLEVDTAAHDAPLEMTGILLGNVDGIV